MTLHVLVLPLFLNKIIFYLYIYSLYYISKMSNKFCSLDPIPTFMLKKCPQELAPILLHIINGFMLQCVFPAEMKTALVKPTIKCVESKNTSDCVIDKSRNITPRSYWRIIILGCDVTLVLRQTVYSEPRAPLILNSCSERLIHRTCTFSFTLIYNLPFVVCCACD